jgi:hypothetical protein
MATRFRHSSPSASRSSTERTHARARWLAFAALAAAVAPSAACGGGEECGPGDAPADGITMEATDAVAEFGQFGSLAANDCPPPEGGEATSITIQGVQTGDGADGRLTLCLPRPDQIEDAPLPLEDSERVQLIDLVATTSDGCRLEVDGDRATSGEVSFAGFCDDGNHADGFALSFAATVPLLRTCGEDPAEPIDAQLAGRAAVTSGAL